MQVKSTGIRMMFVFELGSMRFRPSQNANHKPMLTFVMYIMFLGVGLVAALHSRVPGWLAIGSATLNSSTLQYAEDLITFLSKFCMWIS